MANTYTLIASNTLSSSAASVTFSSIPNTYTDLVLRISARDTTSTPQAEATIRFNSDSATNYSGTQLDGDGSAGVSSARRTSISSLDKNIINANTYTSNTFGSIEIYIPSYQASQNKPLSFFGVTETNATDPTMRAMANLWRNTAAITSVVITAPNNFSSGSSFFLYGIKNS